MLVAGGSIQVDVSNGVFNFNLQSHPEIAVDQNLGSATI